MIRVQYLLLVNKKSALFYFAINLLVFVISENIFIKRCIHSFDKLIFKNYIYVSLVEINRRIIIEINTSYGDK